MKKLIFSLLLPASVVFGQYKLEPAGAPPSELAPTVSATLQQAGSKILNAGGSPLCEVWVRSSLPGGSKAAESNIAFPGIQQGTLIGAIRFPSAGSDRRGQSIKPGVYTLRYSLYPVDGAHQGVAPQRDFLLLVPASADKDPTSQPDYEHLVEMSRKASGTPHPAVLSIEQPQGGGQLPEFVKEGENDWVLNTKVGDVPVGIILVGKHEG